MLATLIVLVCSQLCQATLSETSHAQPLVHRFDTVSGWGAVQEVVLLCRLRPEDLDGAEAVLQQVDSMSKGIMSPALRSRQLLLWADVHKARALGMEQAPPRLVVKALVAAERARALDPCCWRKVGIVIFEARFAELVTFAWTYMAEL